MQNQKSTNHRDHDREQTEYERLTTHQRTPPWKDHRMANPSRHTRRKISKKLCVIKRGILCDCTLYRIITKKIHKKGTSSHRSTLLWIPFPRSSLYRSFTNMEWLCSRYVNFEYQKQWGCDRLSCNTREVYRRKHSNEKHHRDLEFIGVVLL